MSQQQQQQQQQRLAAEQPVVKQGQKQQQQSQQAAIADLAKRSEHIRAYMQQVAAPKEAAVRGQPLPLPPPSPANANSTAKLKQSVRDSVTHCALCCVCRQYDDACRRPCTSIGCLLVHSCKWQGCDSGVQSRQPHASGITTNVESPPTGRQIKLTPTIWMTDWIDGFVCQPA